MSGLGLSSSSGNIVGLLGREWQRPGSRTSWRLDLSYYRRVRPHPIAAGFGCEETCQGENRSRLLALEGDAKVELTRGTVRPYVASGLGVYYSLDVREQNYMCGGFGPNGAFACRENAGPATTHRQAAVGLGLHAGLGVAAVLGRAHVFGELRVLSLSSVPYRSWLAPVVLGVRF